MYLLTLIMDSLQFIQCLSRKRLAMQPVGKNYTGALGDFAPEMQKRALQKKKKEPLKIAIDCNVKAYSMLQI